MTALVAPSYSGHQRLLVPHGATQTQSWRWTGNGCVFPEATRAPVASETAGNVGGEAGRSEARLLDCFGDRELTRQRRLGYWRSKDYQPYNLVEVQSVFFEHICDLMFNNLKQRHKKTLGRFLKLTYGIRLTIEWYIWKITISEFIKSTIDIGVSTLSTPLVAVGGLELFSADPIGFATLRALIWRAVVVGPGALACLSSHRPA